MTTTTAGHVQGPRRQAVDAVAAPALPRAGRHALRGRPGLLPAGGAAAGPAAGAAGGGAARGPDGTGPVRRHVTMDGEGSRGRIRECTFVRVDGVAKGRRGRETRKQIANRKDGDSTVCLLSFLSLWIPPCGCIVRTSLQNKICRVGLEGRANFYKSQPLQSRLHPPFKGRGQYGGSFVMIVDGSPTPTVDRCPPPPSSPTLPPYSHGSDNQRILFQVFTGTYVNVRNILDFLGFKAADGSEGCCRALLVLLLFEACVCTRPSTTDGAGRAPVPVYNNEQCLSPLSTPITHHILLTMLSMYMSSACLPVPKPVGHKKPNAAP